MTATIHRIAPTDVPQNVPAAAATGEEGRARDAALSRSAHSDLTSAVRLLVSHGRLSAAAAAGGDRDMEQRLIAIQGETMVLAGLKLMDAAESLAVLRKIDGAG